MELKDLINNPNSNIVDVRTRNEFNLESLEGSINIPLDDVVQREEELRSMQPKSFKRKIITHEKPK